MNIAVKELVRQPRRFASVGVALTLLVVLLAVLGGFLDGLELSQTGAYRAQEGSLVVFDDEAQLQIQRSRLVAADSEEVAALDEVDAVGGFDQTFFVAAVDGELTDIILLGYDLGTAALPVPPEPGQAVIDAQLQRETGVGVGDTLLVGPAGDPIVVASVVDDLTQGAPSVWVATPEWRRLVGAANPAAVPPEGAHQALVVRPADGVTLDALQASIEDLGPFRAVTPTVAIEALDVVQQQSSTFAGIIAVTFVVTLLVVALFFALITMERVGLYAVLKALGATTGELLRGVSIQAVGVSVVALVLGLALSLLFVSLLPADLPVRLEPARLAQIAVGTVATSVIGSLFTARRILRVDPAEAIG